MPAVSAFCIPPTYCSFEYLSLTFPKLTENAIVYTIVIQRIHHPYVYRVFPYYSEFTYTNTNNSNLQCEHVTPVPIPLLRSVANKMHGKMVIMCVVQTYILCGMKSAYVEHFNGFIVDKIQLDIFSRNERFLSHTTLWMKSTLTFASSILSCQWHCIMHLHILHKLWYRATCVHNLKIWINWTHYHFSVEFLFFPTHVFLGRRIFAR